MAARKSDVTMLEEILWHRRYLRACAIASCACGRKKRAVPEIVAIWAASYEHWNDSLAGHLIAASLLLDGAPIEALP